METVTYLVCNYNYSDYIENALYSILSQDYDGPVNCCIIDDGSTDNSVEKIEQMFESQKELEGNWDGIDYSIFNVNQINIHLLELDSNRGPSKARNVGIQRFIHETDIFAILDMDDWLEPNKTSALVPYFKNPSVGVVYADYITHDIETETQTRVFKEIFSRERLVQECIVHSGSFVRAKALSDVKEPTGFYDETLRVCEDYDLWLRISEKYTIMHHAEFLTHVRVTPFNSTNSVDKIIWQNNYNKVIQKLKLRNNIR